MGTCNVHRGMAPAAHKSIDPIGWSVGPIVDWVTRFMDDKAHTHIHTRSTIPSPSRPIPSQNPNTGRAAITPMQQPQPQPLASRRRRRPRLSAAGAVTACCLLALCGTGSTPTAVVAFTTPGAGVWGSRSSGSSSLGSLAPPPALAPGLAPPAAAGGRRAATRLWMAPITNTRANFVGEVRFWWAVVGDDWGGVTEYEYTDV